MQSCKACSPLPLLLLTCSSSFVGFLFNINSPPFFLRLHHCRFKMRPVNYTSTKSLVILPLLRSLSFFFVGFYSCTEATESLKCHRKRCNTLFFVLSTLPNILKGTFYPCLTGGSQASQKKGLSQHLRHSFDVETLYVFLKPPHLTG